ncbi:MAG TPA: DUF4251 domain-containing protein [Chitinophagaceae bacterium]|jgi:hypothetical protein|nr:DUF4251 domain-containing protein [Chitinophagaceae bacterium]
MIPLILLLTLGWSTGAWAQSEKSRQLSNMETLLEGKRFVFHAQTAFPLRGTMRQLTSEYDLRLQGDSLTIFLPYFGRAYSAPMDLNGSGLRFTSTEFDYTVKARKKDRWDVRIRPKDSRDVQSLNLTIWENGSADLQVQSNNRDPISFRGYVTERK